MISPSERFWLRKKVEYFQRHRNEILKSISENYTTKQVQDLAADLAKNFIDDKCKDMPVGLVVLSLVYSADLLSAQMIDLPETYNQKK